jgi:hypothetical protein
MPLLIVDLVIRDIGLHVARSGGLLLSGIALIAAVSLTIMVDPGGIQEARVQGLEESGEVGGIQASRARDTIDRYI